jgi:hypothetical protein
MLLKMKNILTKDIIYISEAHVSDVCNEGQNLFVGFVHVLCYVMLCYVMLCYAPINVNPEGRGVGQRVGI